MKLKHRCYAGKNFRPQPEILIDEKLQLFAIVTPWGPTFQTKKILEFLVQNYESFYMDEEKTNIYSKMKSLSEDENVLRSLLLSCNEWVFNEQNGAQDCKFGYEIVCGHVKKGKLIFLQVGQPFIYLNRPDIPLQALGHVLDFSGLFSKKGKRLPPLPSTLMGIYPDTHFPVFSFPIDQKDRLLFISRDFVPGSILETADSERNVEHFLSFLTEEHEESPCWVGQLSF